MNDLYKNSKVKWRPFEEARNYARSLGLKSRQEWMNFVRGKHPDRGNKPDDIPIRPLEAYKYYGWCGYCDWLGLPAKRWRSYREARRFVRSLGLQTIEEWRRYCKGEFCDSIGIKPANIPSAPDITLKGRGWINWGDFLGNGIIEKRIAK